MRTQLLKLLSHSYAPYSGIHFACLIEDLKGQLYAGVNVENASYGGTICAERNALNNAITQGVRQFKALYLMTDLDDLMAPCGICKQSLLEFFSEDIECTLMNKAGQEATYNFNNLLTMVFTKKHIPLPKPMN